MIRALQIQRFGGPDVLRIVEQAPVPLRDDGVRIQVAASGVNFADLMMRMGTYPEAPKPPFIPGYEIAGKVIEVGKRVTSFKIGDRVLAGTRFGGYTSDTVLPEFQVRKTPSKLSDVEAAAIPVNFLTAWLALQDMARVRKNDRVLIQSAAGGVGIAAVQIAAQAGAHVVGLVGSKSKADIVKSLGAAEVITNEEWESGQDREWNGFQIILDSTGGESLKRSFKRLAAGGRVVNFGVSSVVSGPKRSFTKLISLVRHTVLFTPYKLMMENKGIFGLNLLPLFEEPKSGEESPIMNAMDSIMRRFEDGSFKVVIGKTFPLNEGGAAQTYLQSRSNIGKIILTP
jgi:NADPH:quinone reductase-like Zn-dependent oxidoreductase